MIEVLRPGQYSTLQDLGRYGYRALGVPVSGPMDRGSAIFANRLLGNNDNAPVIEMCLVGAHLLFHHACTIAFSGGECQIYVNEIRVSSNQVVSIDANSIVKCGAITLGNFLYLSISGGFSSEKVLESACYFPGITENSRLVKGQKLKFNIDHYSSSSKLEPMVQAFNENHVIQVEKGPEFEKLSETSARILFQTSFTISPQSNRMAFLLNGHVDIESREIISSPVQPGTVQLTTGGQLIVLMRDAQTVGGYSRVLQLTNASIDEIAQIRFGEVFKFQLSH